MKPQDYGLMGILPIIRAPTKESGPLAFGLELTSLFPTISSPEPVHAAFAGPWAAGPIKREPDYQIPQAYLVSPPPKITDKIDMFSDETLFYIFYTMPKDAMQVSAARALAKRDWMYHKELKLWFKRVETMKGPNSETGSFLCMDISRWEEVRKDGITLEYEKLERNY
jgi:CCR4-NOT transcription complex subunit 2